MELFGQACRAVREGQELKAQGTCAEDICGKAAVKVETKPRAVLYVFDNSASRIECVDGTDACLDWQGPDVPRTLTFLRPPSTRSVPRWWLPSTTARRWWSSDSFSTPPAAIRRARESQNPRLQAKIGFTFAAAILALCSKN